MAKLPLVSVVIPCFNQGGFVQEALDSVIKQTYANWEVIIVNDGSTDKQTPQALKEIEDKKDKSIKVIHQDNQGLSMARNNGFKIAKGEYILPFDADDMLDKDYLQETVKLAETDSSIGVVTTYVQEFGESNNIWKTKAATLEDELFENSICGNSLIRSKAYFEVKKRNGYGYNPAMKSGFEDWDFWISLLKIGEWKVACVAKPLFNYRIRKTSMLAGSRANFELLYRSVLENHKDIATDKYIELILKLKSENRKLLEDIKTYNKDLIEVTNKHADCHLKLTEIDKQYFDLKEDIKKSSWLAKKMVKNIIKNN